MTSSKNRHDTMSTFCFHPRQQWLFVCCLVLTLTSIVGSLGTDSVDSDNNDTHVGAISASQASVARHWLDRFCSELLKTKKISFVKELIGHLRLLDTSEYPIERSHTKWALRSMISHSSSQLCFENSVAILDLRPIVKEEHNVCSKEHLDLIEDYHKRYIKSAQTGLINSMVSSKAITEHFFMLYAKQVSHMCRKSMLKTLSKMERENVVTEADFEKALPWIRDSSVTNSCAGSNPFERKFRSRDRVTQRKTGNRCKALSVISDIKNIGELAVLLKSPDAVLIMNKLGDADKSNHDKSSEESNNAGDDRDGLIIVVPPNRMQMVADLTTACLKFKPIYDDTVLPVVRLAQMGATTEFNKFDKACAKDPMMSKWFGLTLVCETMLKSRLVERNEKYKKLVDQGLGEDDIFVVYDKCNDKQTDCKTLEKRLSLPKESKLSQLRQIKNVLDDELWIHKYKTTALQRFMDSKRWFNIDDVQSHIVFVQKTSNIKRWVTMGAITALLTAAINKT